MATLTFGQTSNNGNTQTFSGDRMYASKGQPASTGVVKRAKARVWVSGASSPGCRIAIYSDNAGEPNTLLATSDETIVNNTSEAEITFTFSGAQQITVTGGTDYWIAICFDDPGTPNFTISRANTSSLTRFKGITYPTLPSPFAADGSSNGALDVFVEYDTTTADNSSRPAELHGIETLDNSRPAEVTGIDKFDTLQDDFDDNSMDTTTKWTDWGGAATAETNQQLEITNGINDTAYHGFESKYTYDLTDSYVSVELVDAGDQSLESNETYPMDISLNPSNRLIWGVFNGTVIAIKRVAASNTTVFTDTYINATHRWFRIREDSGTVYWETSTDGISWTTRHSESTPFAVNDVAVSILTGTWQNESAGYTAIWDNFNITPSGGEVSDDRDAEVHGTDTANNSRPAELTGSEADDDARPAELHGIETLANARPAETTGSDVDDDSRPAEVSGAEGANDDRDSELHGIDTTTNSRPAETTGSDTANNARPSELHGQDSANNARPAETHGTDTANNARPAETTGSDTANNARPAETTGSVVANSSRGASLQGLDTTRQTQAWLYPGSPAEDADEEYRDGRVINVLRTEYKTLGTNGVLSQLNDPANGENAYNEANALDVLAHCDEAFFTVSGHTTGLVSILGNNSNPINTTKRTNFINTLVDFCVEINFHGVDIDIEGYGGWDATTSSRFITLMDDLGIALHAQGKKLAVCLPAIWNDSAAVSGEPWEMHDSQADFDVTYEAFNGKAVDYITIMAYDYQWDYGSQNPVAPISWIEAICDWAMDKIEDHSKIVIGINSYGYTATDAPDEYDVELLTYDQMVGTPGFAGASRDPDSQELFFSDDGMFYAYSDEVTLNAKRDAIEAKGIYKVSVWHLGGNQWYDGNGGTVDDSRAAQLTGSLGLSDTRAAELSSSENANSSREASLFGVEGSDTYRAAELEGYFAEVGIQVGLNKNTGIKQGTRVNEVGLNKNTGIKMGVSLSDTKH